MNNVFLEVINSVNLVNKKMNDNMKSLFSKYVKLLAVILLSTVGVTQAWGETITMSSIFTGKNQSATITSPLNATVSTTASAGNAANSKLGSDNNYFQIVLTDKTFSAASINGCINSSDKTKNWGFQFTTNGGTTWESEVTQANDGQKSAHDINVGVTIPSGANGIRIIRKAGTSTYVYSVTLTTSGGGCIKPTSPSISGTAAYTVGDNISLTASAETGTDASTTYTWYKGVDWPTASASSPVQATSTSGATFSKPSCVVGDAGTYWCNISNGTGCDVQVSKAIAVSAGGCTSYTVTAASNNNTWGTASTAASSLCDGETSVITATPSSGYRFVSWAVSGTGSTLSSNSTNPTTLTMGTADATVTATFEAIPTHTVTAATETGDDSEGTASVTPSTVGEGETATVTATPASGYVFDHWVVTGTGSSVDDASSATATLTMGTANATVTAYFTEVASGG